MIRLKKQILAPIPHLPQQIEQRADIEALDMLLYPLLQGHNGRYSHTLLLANRLKIRDVSCHCVKLLLMVLLAFSLS